MTRHLKVIFHAFIHVGHRPNAETPRHVWGLTAPLALDTSPWAAGLDSVGHRDLIGQGPSRFRGVLGVNASATRRLVLGPL